MNAIRLLPFKDICRVQRPTSKALSLTCLAGGLIGLPALAATPLPDAGAFDCPLCEILSHDELAARRGGFEYAGLKFEFGANIRSFIDNRLVLESMITITSDGVTHQQTTPLPDSMSVEEPGTPPTPAPVRTPTVAQDAPPAASTVVPYQIHDDTNPVNTPVQSQAQAAQTPANVDLSGLANAFGVSVNDRKGYTAALHEATRERIAGYIINTASRRDLRQELEVKVDVSNFRQYQQTARQTLLNSRFGSSVLK